MRSLTISLMLASLACMSPCASSATPDAEKSAILAVIQQMQEAWDIRIELLAPDAAQLISRYALVRPQRPQYGINTRLMRKVDGRWVIALNHVSSTETPPAESAPPTK